MRENRGFLLLCLLFGLGLCVELCQEQWGDSLAGAIFWVLPLAFTGLILFVVALTRVLKRTGLPWSRRLVPLVGWGAPLLVSYAFGCYLTRIDWMPNWLVISNREGVGYASFEFKRDGQYKYTTGSPLGLLYSYGQYVHRDSLLHLQPTPGQEPPVDTLLVIRPYSTSAALAFDSLARVLPLQTRQPYSSVYYILYHQDAEE